MTPYRFTIQGHQHDEFSALASGWPAGAYYVLPFHVRPAKLRNDVLQLLRNTWFLPVAAMAGTNVFGPYQTKTMRCCHGVASVDPDYEFLNAVEFGLRPDSGIPVRQFEELYAGLHEPSEESVQVNPRKNPRLVCGLRVATVQPEGRERR